MSREFIEVHIGSKFGRNPGSQFGHVAIEIGGKVYSRAPGGYHTDSYSNYVRKNASLRTSLGMRLWVTAHEKQIIRDELERRVRAAIPYNLMDNSCSSNVAEVLGMIGILAHDPRFVAPVTPAEVRAAIAKSNRLVEQRLYRKDNYGGASGNW